MAVARTTYLTVPSELQSLVHVCETSLKRSRFIVLPEYSETDFPETATIYAKKGGQQYFHIFDARIKHERMGLWSGYGRSCTMPSYVVLCIPEATKFRANDLVKIRGLGVGLQTVDSAGLIREIVAPIDLTLNIQLPPLGRHRAAIKEELDTIHKLFNQGDWKRGFEEACKLVEKTARTYLAREARAGRVQTTGKRGTVKNFTASQVRLLPMGSLADVFCKKLTPRPIDGQLCVGLKKINPDRINLAHAKMNRRTEKRLRGEVGRHMWIIDNLLRGIPA